MYSTSESEDSDNRTIYENLQGWVETHHKFTIKRSTICIHLAHRITRKLDSSVHINLNTESFHPLHPHSSSYYLSWSAWRKHLISVQRIHTAMKTSQMSPITPIKSTNKTSARFHLIFPPSYKFMWREATRELSAKEITTSCIQWWPLSALNNTERKLLRSIAINN